MKKRILAIFLSMLLIITGTLSYYPEDVFAAESASPGSSVNPSNSSASAGTRKINGYRIGMALTDDFEYTYKDKMDRQAYTEFGQQFKEWVSKHYLSAPSESSIHCAFGQSLDKKGADDETGRPSGQNLKVFYNGLTEKDTLRTKLSYVGTKLSGIIADELENGKDPDAYLESLKHAASIISRHNLDKSKAVTDMKELMSSGTKLASSLQYWTGQYKGSWDFDNDSYSQFAKQYCAMLEICLIRPTEHNKKMIRKYVEVAQNREITKSNGIPVITIEAMVNVYDGSQGFWMSTGEILAYWTNSTVSSFKKFPNNKAYTSVASMLSAYYKQWPKVRSTMKKNTTGWVVKLLPHCFNIIPKFSGDNLTFSNVSQSSTYPGYMKLINNENGFDGYGMSTEIIDIKSPNPPKGSFSWKLSENNSKSDKIPYNITDKGWGVAVNSKQGKLNKHKLQLTAINTQQTSSDSKAEWRKWISSKSGKGTFQIVFGYKRTRYNKPSLGGKLKASYTDTKFNDKWKFVNQSSNIQESVKDVKVTGRYTTSDGVKKNINTTCGTWTNVSAKELQGMLCKTTNFTIGGDTLSWVITKGKPQYIHYMMTIKVRWSADGSTNWETQTLTNTDVKHTGYKYEKVDDGTYEVRYYYDDVLDDSATTKTKANPGTKVTTYTAKPKSSYTWSMTEPAGTPQQDGKTNLTVSKQASDNIINVYYSSKPKQYYYESAIETPYAEIKCGYVDNSGAHEPYEAMSGFPTTENLYFASGGKEFMVQLKYEYVKEKNSYRTYTQKSNEAKSSLHIGYKVVKGNQDNKNPGSKPADEKATCPTCGATISATYLPFRTAETRWNWYGTKTKTVKYQVGVKEDGTPIMQTDTATATVTASDTATKPENVTVTNGRATATAVAQKTEATAWNWDWRCYGHADTTASQTESGLPYTSDIKTYNNVHTQTTYKTTANGKYTNVKTVVSNSSANGTFNNEKANGNVYHHISWNQNITDFNYAKITNVRVWQLTESKVKNTYEFTGTDEVSATLQSVAPSYLYNVASKDTASAGRLWHSEHSAEQDEYFFSTFNASNYCHNCVEYMAAKTLKEKNPDKIYNDTTCISDYLILRTSAGDLSMIYFEYNANNKTVPVGVVNLTGSVKGGSYTIDSKDVSFKSQNNNATEALICNGAQSFSGINLQPDDITYGGYNGNYKSPSSKFVSSKGFTENINVNSTTINKNTYSKYKASSRPSSTFKLVKTVDVPDQTTSNGSYYPSDSSVFYKEVIRYDYNGTIDDILESTVQPEYGNKKGFTLPTTYSPLHPKINDIVVHNPVTTQYSVLIPLDKSRDQRTDDAVKADQVDDDGKCSGLAEECAYSHLNCQYAGTEYHTDECYSIIRETTHDDSLNAHVHTAACYHKHTDACYTGSNSYNVNNVTKNSFTYTTGSGTDFYSFTATAPGRVNFYSTYNNADPRGRVYVNGVLKVDNDDGNGSLNFKTGYVSFNKGDTVRLNVYPYGSRSAGTINGVASVEYLKPICGQIEGQVGTVEGTKYTYGYTGSVQTVTLPAGQYKLEAWGSVGGNGSGGYGGYSKGDITLTSTTKLYIYTGSSSGYNGGGSGKSPGGGATHIALSDGLLPSLVSNKSSILLVAGGGGGVGPAAGGAGGGANLNGGDGTRKYGGIGYGGTLTAGGAGGSYGGTSGSFGQGGSNTTSAGSSGRAGGGGGYYGGGAGGNDYPRFTDYDDSGAGGGSGYADTSRLKNISGTNGVNSSNGKVVITQLKSTCTGELNTHVHTSTCYTSTVQYTLSCDEPHHSMNTKYTYYIAGWKHTNGKVCTGEGCTYCASNIELISPSGEVVKPSELTTKYSLISHDGSYHIGLGNHCVTCGKDVTIDTHLENGKNVQSKFNLTKTDGASIHTKSLKDSVYHYSFGDETCWDACGNDANHKKNPTSINTPAGSYPTSGDFVNLDYGFKIYFPNTGNFYGNGAYGISDISNTEGKGYTSPMDTTTWVKAKYVVFDFDVIYDKDKDGDFSDDKLYLAGEPIPLGTFSYKGTNAKNNFNDDSPDDYMYNFYVPLENSEIHNGHVKFCAVALNSGSDEWSENQTTHNYERTNYYAAHDAMKEVFVDVVGRVGSMTMMDSGDFRFSNFFKQPTNSGWLVDNIVREVDVRKQNYWLADPLNIRGEKGTSKTNGLNTYGTQFFKSDLSKLLYMPLVPMYNNIDALKKQPQRIGYMNLMSLETIGNYYGIASADVPGSENYKVQIQPFYYHLDVNTGKWTPVDVYMLNGTTYSKINEFGNKNATTDYQWNYSLNWLDESARRMYSTGEKKATDNVVEDYATPVFTNEDGEAVFKRIQIASGREYQYGTAQMLFLRARNRTFIGSSVTEGNTTNPGNRVSVETDNGVDYESPYQKQGQRWHFSLGLPSSAVFVEHGKACTQENINKLTNDHSVIVTALEVYVKGEVWTLKYKNNDVSNQKIQVTKDTPVWDYSNDPNGPGDKIIVTVTTTPKHSSKHDLQTEGTH